MAYITEFGLYIAIRSTICTRNESLVDTELY